MRVQRYSASRECVHDRQVTFPAATVLETRLGLNAAIDRARSTQFRRSAEISLGALILRIVFEAIIPFVLRYSQFFSNLSESTKVCSFCRRSSVKHDADRAQRGHAGRSEIQFRRRSCLRTNGHSETRSHSRPQAGHARARHCDAPGSFRVLQRIECMTTEDAGMLKKHEWEWVFGTY
jgi:hypothetical protein